MVAIASLKPEFIFRAVEQMYTSVAREPEREFHFPTGASACLAVGYPEAELRGLPPAALESFAGVGYPFRVDAVRSGDIVLDIGCGSGTDTLIASHRVGPAGKVYALDMTAAMRVKLAATLQASGISNVEIIAGNTQAIPLPDHSIDVVTSNGVLNLVPDKARAFAEIFRVLKPGGRVQIADIALHKPIADKYRCDPSMWAECVVGAVEERKYLEMLNAAGLEDPEAIENFDYFALSRSADTRTVAGLFGARSVVLRARKPFHAAAAVPHSDTIQKPGWNKFVQETAAVATAGAAFAICASLPALLSAIAAAGAAALLRYGSLYAVFIGCVAFGLWLHYTTARAQAYLIPVVVAAVCGAVGVGLFALLLIGWIPTLWWAPYVALGAMVGAGLWSFVRGLRESCVTQMVREAQRRS